MLNILIELTKYIFQQNITIHEIPLKKYIYTIFTIFAAQIMSNFKLCSGQLENVFDCLWPPFLYVAPPNSLFLSGLRPTKKKVLVAPALSLSLGIKIIAPYMLLF